MASQVEIVKRALVALGETVLITSVDDETVPAQLAKEIWTSSVEYILTVHPWSCAQKRWDIAADVTSPVWGFGYQYTKPVDCVAVFEVKGQESEDWKVESGKILTDMGPSILISGNRTVTNAADFDASMVEALAYKLAMEMAVGITGSKTLRDDMEAALKDRTVNSRTMTSRQRTGQKTMVSTWLDARHSGLRVR